MRRVLIEQEIADIRQRYLDGEQIVSIAIRLECSPQSVAKHTKDLRASRKRAVQTQTKVRNMLILQMARNGSTTQEISHDCCVSEALVRSICNENGVRIRRLGNHTQSHVEYVPTKPIVHVPSENPDYPGFYLEEDAVERLRQARISMIRRKLSGKEYHLHYEEKS